MEKVSRDVAIEEINKWLNAKKISDKKREFNKENIETLVDSIVEGSLSLKEEDNVLVQNLKFPIESSDGKPAYTQLEYKPRIKMETVHLHLQNVKGSDADGRVCAYIAALTGKPKDLIKKLDTEDYSVGTSIAIFFL